MLLVLTSLVLLIIFFSFFVSIKFNNNSVNFTDSYKPPTVLEEKIPASSADARYQEMRYEFLRFAEFFLLLKRPFGIKESINNINNVSGSVGVTGHDKGSSDASTYDKCKTLCETDTNCNLWKFESDKTKCTRYEINSIDDVNKDDTVSTKIGYVFRTKDDWAVNDLSELPNQKELFQGIAAMVIKLQCKVPELLKRAKSISSNSNVKYCYEQDITASGVGDTYIENKNNALKHFENAALFFIFKGTSDYSNKLEFSLLASRILKLIFNFEESSENEIVFVGNDNKTDIKSAVAEIDKSHNDYKSIKSWFSTHYDKNSDGYITRDELKSIYKNAVTTNSNINTDHIDDSLQLNFTECSNNDDINENINQFFDLYDMDRDGKVSIDDILTKIDDIKQPVLSSLNCVD